jgi:aryl-alcohol dehydrogenase-like predicted oxidoreductase
VEAGRLHEMMGEQEAVVVDVKPFNLHGVTYHDVAIAYRDRSVDEARLGPESVPENLQAGEVVLATKVANMVVSLRRP